MSDRDSGKNQSWLPRRLRRGKRNESDFRDASGAVEVEATRPCPYCKEPVSRGATACLHCERELVKVMDPGTFAQRFGSFPMAESDSDGGQEESP